MTAQGERAAIGVSNGAAEGAVLGMLLAGTVAGYSAVAALSVVTGLLSLFPPARFSV